MFEEADAPIIITNILVGDSHIEIGYLEKRLQGERAGVVSTILIDRLVAGEALEELLEIATDIVDKGLLEIRKPESTLDPRKRLSRRAESVPDED